jgi:phytoene synthase
VSSTTELAGAYSHCEAVTREQAANFYYGIRLLPRERRRAMCAVYAFARRVDDIGDGTLEREEKLSRLDAEARALAGLERGEPAAAGAGGDPVMFALADAYARFALPPGALGELIEGVRMDVEGVTYERFEELVLYCRRVAGAIGRVCLAIFGLREGAATDAPGAERLADDLGVALQLTNILRDVAEDAANGRVYLPAEDLRRFGVIEQAGDSTQGAAEAAQLLAVLAPGGPVDPSPTTGALSAERLADLVHFEAQRARQWFDTGLALAPLLDRRSAACVLAMAGIYRRLLDRIDAQPQDALRQRVSLPTREKAWVAARGMLGGGARWA